MAISNLSNGLRTGVCTSTNRPTTPYEGQVIYETDTDNMYVWNGTAWVLLPPTASPTFTGVPSAPTATAGTNTTQLATTAFVTTADNLKADLASPTLTGTPLAPTATAGTSTTQLATTAFVTTQTVNTQTGTTYSLLAADLTKMVTLSNGSAITVTVGTSLGLSAGQTIDLLQLGAGQVTVAAGGATLVGTPGLKFRAQYSAATLYCIGTNSFVLIGDLAA